MCGRETIPPNIWNDFVYKSHNFEGLASFVLSCFHVLLRFKYFSIISYACSDGTFWVIIYPHFIVLKILLCWTFGKFIRFWFIVALHYFWYVTTWYLLRNVLYIHSDRLVFVYSFLSQHAPNSLISRLSYVLVMWIWAFKKVNPRKHSNRFLTYYEMETYSTIKHFEAKEIWSFQVSSQKALSFQEFCYIKPRFVWVEFEKKM